jgi:hypothetical protein
MCKIILETRFLLSIGQLIRLQTSRGRINVLPQHRTLWNACQNMRLYSQFESLTVRQFFRDRYSPLGFRPREMANNGSTVTRLPSEALLDG